MDKTIRKNEHCIIGQPRCDFVFSSTRSCFIAYGFEESPLEMSLLRGLLKERGVEAIEAGGMLAPGQSAFCAKICSKIITSQFCIVLLNNDASEGQEIPNANVNMEYGLMLGFNKFVIPFQRKSQNLPFNVAGLDTVKYESGDLERLAIAAIDHAISDTNQDTTSVAVPLDQQIGTFLLVLRSIVSPISSEGEKNLYDLGSPLGFNLLNDFGGMSYMYFGNFSNQRQDAVIWRVRMLDEILKERILAVPAKTQAGRGTLEQGVVIENILNEIQIWVLVTSNEDKHSITEILAKFPLDHNCKIFSITEMSNIVTSLDFQKVVS